MCCGGWNGAAFRRPTMSSIASTNAPSRATTRSARRKFWSACRQRRRKSDARWIPAISSSAMLQSMRHAILGAGGVGGLIGAVLAKSGQSVTMVVRPESLAHYPAQLQLESLFGNFSVPVARAAEVPPADVLWIAVKATQLEAALTSFTKPDSVTAIVPLLNGIDHLALLRARYGDARVIAATIAVETERVAPGHIIHRSPFANLNMS